MKTILVDNDGFNTKVELREVLSPQGSVQLRFLTEWDKAKRDVGDHVQYEVVLTVAQLKNLKDLL
jgi:hypothetical protein